MQGTQINFAKASVLIMAIGISILFFFMVKGFLMAIVLSAIFSGVMYGFFERLTRYFKGRRSLASILTVIIFVLTILIPVSILMMMMVEQALQAGRSFLPRVENSLSRPDSFVDELESIDIVQRIFKDRDKLLATVNNAIDSLGKFVASGLSQFTTGAVTFLFNLFIFLFAMYYFLMHGREYLNKALYYLPLYTAQEKLLLDKFVRVTRSTLKGTLIIGVVQGGLAAVAMAFAGISNTLFWGVVMAVLSIIPALGPALVWAPAGVFLILTGHVAAGVSLILFGVIVIGNIDNLMRPRLIGHDTKLPDLMIFFGTLGGLALFGMAGIIIGPIVAALFVTIWEIYGETFKDQLQPVEFLEEE